jgi:hypothetical protein
MLVGGTVTRILGLDAEVRIRGALVLVPADELREGDLLQLDIPSQRPARISRSALTLILIPAEVSEGQDLGAATDDDEVQPAASGDRESHPPSTVLLPSW